MVMHEHVGEPRVVNRHCRLLDDHAVDVCIALGEHHRASHINRGRGLEQLDLAPLIGCFNHFHSPMRKNQLLSFWHSHISCES